MPKLLITVDTELSNFPQSMGIWGRIGGEDWGLGRLIDTFDEIGVRGTFFLDAYADGDKDVADQCRAAQLIAARRHDLQLHTHPAPAFDRARDQLRHYSLSEQEDIIGIGCQRILEWSGVRPLLHRAGDWAANDDSLRALHTHGFLADFSASPWSPSCAFDPDKVAGNGWVRIDGMLCGVGTCYHDRITGRMRRVDLGGVSFSEALDVLSRQIDPFFLTLHSFSLMRHNTSRTKFIPAPDYIKRLRQFCAIAREQFGYRTMSAMEATTEMHKLPDDALPWASLPKTTALSSAAGIVKSLQGRLTAYSQ